MALAFKLQREGDYIATVTAGGGRLRDIWHITGLALGQSRFLISNQLIAHLQTVGWDQVKDGLPIAAIKIRKKPPGIRAGAMVHAASAMVIYASGGFGGGGGLPIAYSRSGGYLESHEVPVFSRINSLWDEKKLIVKRPARGLIFNQRVQEGDYVGQRNEALLLQGLLKDFGVLGFYLFEDVDFVRKSNNEIRAELTFTQKGNVPDYPVGSVGNEVLVPSLGQMEEYKRVESDGALAPALTRVGAVTLYDVMSSNALSWVDFDS